MIDAEDAKEKSYSLASFLLYADTGLIFISIFHHASHLQDLRFILPIRLASANTEPLALYTFELLR